MAIFGWPTWMCQLFGHRTLRACIWDALHVSGCADATTRSGKKQGSMWTPPVECLKPSTGTNEITDGKSGRALLLSLN